MKDRPPKGCVAQAQTELLAPERLERRPSGEFVMAIAATVARTSKMTAEGPQLAKSKAAVRTRCPSVPSIASTREVSSQGPS